jgi:hypothetical protein
VESTDLFLVGAEVGVAYAGFAGIIATFQFKGAKRIRRGDVVGLTMILQLSLNCALLSALPLLLSSFQINTAAIWTFCSLYGGSYVAYTMLTVYRNMRGATKRWAARLLFGSLYALSGLGVLVQFLNASNLIFHREPGPYIAGIILGLGIVGFMFGRLLLRPLWRAVKEQEAVDLSQNTTA